MVTVGEFARLGGVTVRLLHHYHEIGLLSPAHIDSASNWRYYSPDQATTLRLILQLRDLGMALDEIRDLLDAGLLPANFAALLRQRREQILGDLRDQRRRLRQVEQLIRTWEAQPGAGGPLWQ